MTARQHRPGGRSARVRTAVHAAALRHLVERGYEGLAIEAVATTAGVHKTTVYRRWPTKADLVLDALLERQAAVLPIPDTGSLEGDLEALAAAVLSNLTSPEGAALARAVVAAAASNADLRAAASTFWATRFALAAPITERAVARGELPPGSDPVVVVESVIAPLFFRLLLTAEPLDRPSAVRAVRVALRGVADRN
jgi:AcrR family transcriptional regulator